MSFSKGNRRGINRAALNMSSMIDVTFLLLIYFIVSTVLSKPEDQLNPTLMVDQGTAVNESLLEPQIILVEKRNLIPVYALGDLVFTSREELSKVLQALPKDPGVIIKADNNVLVAFAVAAIQESRDAGFEKVTYVPNDN